MSAAMLDKSLRDYPGEIKEELASLNETLDIADAVYVFQALIECISGLGQVKKELARHIANSTDAKKMQLDGIGTVEIGWSQSRKITDRPLLFSAIVARVVDEPANLFDPETGSILPPAIIGENIANALTKCLHVDYARKGALQLLGLDWDTYTEKGEWTPSVRVIP